MKQRIGLLTLLFIFYIGILPAAAQGIIVPPPGVDSDPSTLMIDYQRVSVTINNQIATTKADMQFTNRGERMAEGTFLFPLPQGATVDRLTMWVDGTAVDAKILAADEARQIYIDTVRQLIDPALLEYVGSSLIQARIFPIDPGASRRIEIEYSQVLEVENGLFQYVYPLHTAGTSARMINQMSISVDVASADAISNVYSPSHNIVISRSGDKNFRAGFEANFFTPDQDFNLYYGIASDTINLNLLTYRESANQDGFFMLLVQPPVTVDAAQIVPKDVIIVLDQSGSMQGEKWEQAREAAVAVLEKLNPQDRFNIITFSTGWRIYSNELLSAAEAPGAINWVQGLFAEGGTDINGALTTAFDMAHAERPTTILFMTDGLATEGVTETDVILANLKQSAQSNIRVFTFGVGDDVDTFLLDAIVRDHRGAGSYVRPSERIDEEVGSLYNKISAPVLTNIQIRFDNVLTELTYPQQLPDLFAGEQLTLVGRYRGSAEDVTITLSGTTTGQQQSFVYSGNNFPAVSGGESLIARLWATRRIGELLNNIRLNGENPELVQSVVDLSIRYGIITPYTSFLIEEDDILTEQGRSRAQDAFREEAESLAGESSGERAVSAADTTLNLQSANAPAPALGYQATMTPAATATGDFGGGAVDQDEAQVAPAEPAVNPIQTVRGKTFILQNGTWTDTTFQPDSMTTEKVNFLSDEYFALLDEHPELADYFAIGDRVIVVLDGTAYEVTSA